MKFSSVVLGALLGTATAAPAALGKRQQEFTDYLFVYFTGEGTENGEQIYISVSNNNDPSSWTKVGPAGPNAVSTVGTTGVRDPSIIRSPDGSKFYIVATDLWVYPRGWNVGDDYTTNGSKGLVVFESEDLLNWSEGALRMVSPENAGMTWAPDAIWDPSREQYLVHWTSNLIGEGWFIMRSFTSDFVTFSTAEKWLTGAGMDTTVKYDAGSDTYIRISKNGAGELIEQANAPTLDGPWTVIRDGIGEGLPAGEGPLAFQDNSDPSVWHLFIDDYTRGRGYQPFETNDILSATWSASGSITLDQPYRHGYVIGITAEERARLG
ncbi:endo-1,4-beta-xylanase [Stachybotrys elegans]|uniref:Endo-1,4-beta-xylanase n=1 Tax=Stachybotrys elegans TaxID=80388 RepID=A0A8K0SUZ0_9HYPO|nr:endo-1,4-beta-xylanase [Stachybotrys elegans]